MLRKILDIQNKFVLLMIISTVFLTAHQVHADEKQPDYLNDEFYENGLESEEYILDRLEPLNRIFFTFNDRVYLWVLEPAATVYSNILPSDIRVCVANFFRNLEEPVRFVNSLLQGRFGDAGDVFMRFVINSTLGVYGLGDPADRVFFYPPVEASMGETFEKWGIGDGSYLVVPFYGSSTIRDFAGTLIDGFGMTPYYSWTDENAVMAATYAGKETNKISLHLGEYEDFKQVFFDPYVGFRNAYFQYRRKLRDHPFQQAEELD